MSARSRMAGVSYEWETLRAAIQYDLDRKGDGKLDKQEAEGAKGR